MANEINQKNKKNGAKQSVLATAWANLSKREHAMIYSLIVLGAIAALVLLLIMPGIESIHVLEERATLAEQKKEDYQLKIREGQTAGQSVAAAQEKYNEAKKKLYRKMLPESLDATVTGYLTSAGFNPQTMSMSPLSNLQIRSFSPMQSDDPTAPGPGVGMQGSDSSLGAEAPDANTGIHTDIDVYAVNITANGTWNNMYALLSKIASKNGVEITQYRFADAAPSAGASTKKKKNDELTPSARGSFSITIAFYVNALDERAAPVAQ